eukprot:scaffold2434_cov70-Cyclotella_meneghiniana.AAC.4
MARQSIGTFSPTVGQCWKGTLGWWSGGNVVVGGRLSVLIHLTWLVWLQGKTKTRERIWGTF